MMESVPPDPRSPGAAVGVTEPMIHALVHGFYDAIRTDPMLGPIFDREIGDGWDAHLETMCNFWSSVVLMSGRFKGAPMVVHARISDINGVHFTRWLQLFRQAARALTPPDGAVRLIGHWQNSPYPARYQTVAAVQAVSASARKRRSVDLLIRWRWMLKVL